MEEFHMNILHYFYLALGLIAFNPVTHAMQPIEQNNSDEPRRASSAPGNFTMPSGNFNSPEHEAKQADPRSISVPLNNATLRLSPQIATWTASFFEHRRLQPVRRPQPLPHTHSTTLLALLQGNVTNQQQAPTQEHKEEKKQ